jgi:hypothetical protein
LALHIHGDQRLSTQIQQPAGIGGGAGIGGH